MNLLLKVTNPTGLQARPAAVFAATAKKFQSNIQLRNLTQGSEWADAKSVPGVLGVGAERFHEIELRIEGLDAQEAASSLRAVVESGLGEEQTAANAKVTAETPQGAPDQRILEGIPGAPGIAIGQARLWNTASLSVPRRTGCDPTAENKRLDLARDATREELAQLQASVAAKVGAAESKIFEAHQMFLDDPSLLNAAANSLRQGLNAEAAWIDSVKEAAALIGKVSDPTLAARAIDLRDVGDRVLKHLLGESTPLAAHHTEAGIVIAGDLSPSQTAGMDKSLVLAICTAEGGPAAHTVILARALQIPAVVGLGKAIFSVKQNETLIVNGSTGRVTRNPTESEILEAQQQRSGQEKTSQVTLAASAEAAITRDGQRVEVVANVGSVEDCRKALELGAEGIGLLRTEFLYIQRDAAPSEEEQYDAYKAIFDVMHGLPVVVRTLDAGGDKTLPYLELPPEQNPFLGWRAIRICLERPDIFQPQLRALLRAGSGHDLRLMFPMIATLAEIRAAKAAVAEARGVLQSSGLPMAERVQLGMMVEIPSAAVMADIFAREVDFFSIGTNDLTQYTMAAERTNAHVAQLSDAIHPAILRLIKQVVDAAHAAGRWAGVCGELGGDAQAIPILLGFGVDELSMTPALIPRAKEIIRACDTSAAGRLAVRALALESAEAVRAMVRAEFSR